MPIIITRSVKIVIFSFLLLSTILLLIQKSYAKDISKSIENGQKKAAVCAACHGVDGRAASGGNSALVPNIFAQNKDYLIVKLKEYKSGKINHPQMSLIAQMLTEDQILNVSEWYSMISVELKLPE